MTNTLAVLCETLATPTATPELKHQDTRTQDYDYAVISDRGSFITGAPHSVTANHSITMPTEWNKERKKMAEELHKDLTDSLDVMFFTDHPPPGFCPEPV